MKPYMLLPAVTALLLAACAANAHDRQAVLSTAVQTRSMQAGTRLSGAESRSPARGRRGTGLIRGTFLAEGGPLGPGGTQPPVRPLSGTVRFTAGHLLDRIRVGSSGRFALRLRTGTYRVSANSPSIVEVLASGARRDAPCSQPLSVTVVAGRTARIAVTCITP